MSVSGSVFFLGYLLLDFLTHEMLPASFRYFLLKLGGLFFLVPFPLVKSLVQSWLFHCENGILKTDEYYFFDIDHSIKLIDEGFIFPQLLDSQKALIGLWAGIVILIILSQVYRFYLFRHNLRKYLLPFDNCDDLLDSIKADMNITKKVSVYYCGAEISPFTCGVKSPIIILTSLVTDDSEELILRHELQHIKSHDLIYRIAALFIVLIHCFNPLSYLFLKELKEVQEMNCDEKLTVTFSNNERMKYGKAIIAVSARARVVESVWRSTGINLYEVLLDIRTGHEFHVDIDKIRREKVAFSMIPVEEGVVEEIKGFDLVNKSKHIVYAEPWVEIGERIRARQANYGGFIFATGGDIENMFVYNYSKLVHSFDCQLLNSLKYHS